MEQSNNYRNLACDANINKKCIYKDMNFKVLNVFKN